MNVEDQQLLNLPLLTPQNACNTPGTQCKTDELPPPGMHSASPNVLGTLTASTKGSNNAWIIVATTTTTTAIISYFGSVLRFHNTTLSSITRGPHKGLEFLNTKLASCRAGSQAWCHRPTFNRDFVIFVSLN
jgi:hypothetical protein